MISYTRIFIHSRGPWAIGHCAPDARLAGAVVVTLLAHRLTLDGPLPVRSAAWHTKYEATFSDVIACVRRYLWTHTHFVQSQAQTAISADVLHGLVDVLCYAA